MSEYWAVEGLLEHHEIPRTLWDGTETTYSGWYAWEEISPIGKPVNLTPTKTAELVSVDSGSEGDWHKEISLVWKVTDGNDTRYYKKTGYYASHDGTYWDGRFSE